MTSTASFKDKIKQIFSVFLWELKSCTGTLTVYSILAGVFTIIILTMSLVSSDYLSGSYSMSELQVELSEKIEIFQVSAATVINLLTVIFTIFYTIRVYSYMHDKRKADFYGPLPISRARMYLSKTLSAYVFSVVPALFFMALISLICVCTGTPINDYVITIYFSLIIGTLACVTAYGLVATCCGTTLNSVIMFLVVCISYPIAMGLLTAIVSAFYPGFYMGTISDSFITSALNPMSAYGGTNKLYWIIFSILCVVGTTVLIMKRKSERAQTSFAYYLPCYLVKLMVSFICGVFLGSIFASVNVFNYGLLGFIFGFILASIPAYIITHLIFYKDFKKLLVSSIPLGAMIVLVIVGSCIFNFDLFGYNSYVPDLENIKSAGFIDSEQYMPKSGKSLYQVSRKSADDITDPELIADIVEAHQIFTEYNEYDSCKKFQNIWISMFANAFGDLAGEDAITFAYKLDNGMTVTRYYRMDFSLFDEESYDYDLRSKVHDKVYGVFAEKEYILNYSGTANADFVDDKEIEEIRIFAFDSENTVRGAEISTDDSYYDFYDYYEDDDEDGLTEKELERQKMMYQISQAFIKDLEADETTYKTVLLDPYDDVYGTNDDYSYSIYSDEYGYETNSWLSIYDGSMLYYVNNNIDKDIVCQINVSSSDGSNGIFSSYYGTEETFYIPSSYTNTLEALRNYGIIDSNNKINKYSEFAEGIY